MNPKVRGTSKNGSIRANKSKINELCKKLIKELQELVYRKTEKNKSYNTRRRVNRLGLKKIWKRQNLTNKDIKNAKHVNELTTHGLKLFLSSES